MRYFFLLISFVGSFFTLFANESGVDANIKFAEYKQFMNEIILKVCKDIETNGDQYGLLDDDDLSFIKDKADLIFSKLEENFQSQMKIWSPCYAFSVAIKAIIDSPFFEEGMKKNILKAFALRDECFDKINALCDKYPDEERAIKIKNEIDGRVCFSDSIFEEIKLFNIGKSSLLTKDEEKGSYNLFLESLIKYLYIDEIIEDVLDDYYYDSYTYENILNYGYVKTILEICKRSANEKLKDIFLKYQDINSTEEVTNSIFRLSLLTSSYYEYYSEFDFELNNILYDYEDELDNLLCDFVF